MESRVFILIPVYNRIETTKRGLKYLYHALNNTVNALGGGNFDVVVIDDGSTDGTSEWITANYPEIVILKGDGNLWWSGGINLGAAYAIEHHATHILLWNDDIKPCEGYFNTLLYLTEKQGQDIIYGSKIVDEANGRIWFLGAHYFAYWGFVKHLRKHYDWCSPNCLTGMGTLLPMQVIEKIGYWDNENFPQYYGDIDFTYRAYRNGYRIKVEDGLLLYNDTRLSSFNQERSIKKYWRSLFMTQSRYNIKKNILFQRKHARLFTWWVGFVAKQIQYLFSLFLHR